MNAVEQAPAPARPQRAARLLGRFLVVLAVAWSVGTLSGWIYAREGGRTEPAGFLIGMIHGAAMPCALPALLTGADPILYTPVNSGRPYKLGYTVGVNACGAVFFGLLYRRFARRRVLRPEIQDQYHVER